MPAFIAVCISSCFYIGFLPLVPGTFGSVAGLALFGLVRHSATAYLTALAAVVMLGFLFCGAAEKRLGKKDHRAIVIDEVAGMLISVGFLPPEPRLYIIGFFLFRLLDTVKPYPADRLQERPGAFGIMSDDIVAAIYTNLILQVVARFV